MMMMSVRWRAASVGAAFAVVSYYLLGFGILRPAADVLAVADEGVLTVVVVAVQVGLLVMAGWIAASLVRRRWGLERRRDALVTVLGAGPWRGRWSRR